MRYVALRGKCQRIPASSFTRVASQRIVQSMWKWRFKRRSFFLYCQTAGPLTGEWGDVFRSCKAIWTVHCNQSATYWSVIAHDAQILQTWRVQSLAQHGRTAVKWMDEYCDSDRGMHSGREPGWPLTGRSAEVHGDRQRARNDGWLLAFDVIVKQLVTWWT